MILANVKHGWQQKGVRRFKATTYQPDIRVEMGRPVSTWFLQLAGCVKADWQPPTWAEIASYASRIGVKDLDTFCKARRSG
jgi:hypothetical protein